MQNPLSDADIQALLRLLAIVENRVTETCDSLLAQQLRDGFAAGGLVPRDADTAAVGGAIAQLQLRYRYALGEYSERPTDDTCETHDC